MNRLLVAGFVSMCLAGVLIVATQFAQMAPKILAATGFGSDDNVTEVMYKDLSLNK